MLNSKMIKGGILIFCLGAQSLFACGGCYQGRLLDGRNGVMLVAPEANFRREIDSMKLVATHRAVISTNGFSAETAGAELAELKRALESGGKPAAEVTRILSKYVAQRNILSQHTEQRENWTRTNSMWWGLAQPASNNPFAGFIKADAAKVPAGLPPEFADYFQGAIAWHCGQTNEAVAAWESVLARPAAERQYRSTWAAFMLGRAKWETDPALGLKYFQQVRLLTGAGFADSLGLAAASLGAEARVEYRRKNYAWAISLYLDQAASGDDSAYNSLRFAASDALRNQSTSLKSLAADPRVQPVITAYIISGGWSDDPVDVDGVIREPVVRLLEKQSFVSPPAGGWHKMDSPARLWLEAVEAAKVRDVLSAEKLALAAYQCGEFSIAARWIDRAPDSVTSQWLKSKLLLRDGKTEQAAALLTKLVAQFPVGAVEANGKTNSTLYGRIAVWDDWCDPVQLPAQMLGELGALRLTRREYTEALDALLRSGYVEDAAYVADRVLTIEELKTYVNRCWPKVVPNNMRMQLGQRLFRARRFAEAREYFDAPQQEFLDLYVKSLSDGHDDTKPKAERASLLWQCAQAIRADHSVIQPPVETEWSTTSGVFEYTGDLPGRIRYMTNSLLPVTLDEQKRVAQTSTFPDRSLHRRFAAANMAWEAAQLMPDNSDETARVLWQGGTWIKYADPKAADVFYKSLVRRCRKTALGDAADRRRWFPSLDENGNILPFKPRDGTAMADDPVVNETIPASPDVSE